ncbi:MAG: ABC transporter ATP-binding protein [Acidilobaceae archaeon]|nr:ABC transporter ATP-binding protein [Acidilobaceae archaeon]
MLKVESLNVGYGKFHIVFDVSFEVKERSIFTIVGPNGGGKTTLLNGIMGIATVFSGRVLLKGQDITHLPPHQKARLGIGYMAQTDNIFPGLTVIENLLMAAYGLPESVARDRMETVFTYYPVLKRRTGQKARSLSGGERQMLAISMTLMRDPDVIMLDEPTSGLAPILAKDLLKKIAAMRDELKKTVLLVEQNVKAALEISDDAMLLVSGRSEFVGKAQALLSDEALGRKYLGVK